MRLSAWAAAALALLAPLCALAQSITAQGAGGGSGAVSSVGGTAGQITVSPVTGSVTVSLSPTITQAQTFAAKTNVTNSGQLQVVIDPTTSTTAGCVLASSNCGFWVVEALDPSVGPDASRWNMFQTTLTTSSTTTNHWENVNSWIFLNGTGTFSKEVNGFHSYFQLASTASLTVAEGFESSFLNSGATTNFTNFLGINTNDTSATIGGITGYVATLINNNSAAGSVNTWIGYACGAVTGTGSQPTGNYCIKNTDATASISTAGNVLIGGIGAAATNEMLHITGSDTGSNSTFPIVIKDSGGTIQFYTTTNKGAFFASSLTLGSGTTKGFLTLNSNVAAQGVTLSTVSGTAGNTNIVIPQGTATTLAGLAVQETFTADQGFNAHIRASGSAPVLTSCGTSPSISGSDLAGQVTLGTGSPTGCVITFASAYTTAPYCVVTWQATPLASQSYAITNTAITITQTATSSNTINYMCMARNGG